MKEAAATTDRDDMKYCELSNLWLSPALCLRNVILVNEQCRSVGRTKTLMRRSASS